MSLSQSARLLLGSASFAAMLIVASAPGGAQAPQAPAPAQAAPAKAAKAPAKAKAAEKSQGEGEDAQAAAQPKKKDPVAAQQSIDTGIRLLQGGKAEQAIQTFTSAIAGGQLPPPQMARALYHRGVAYRKANKPAQAISDLTSALWLKNGLQDADRQDAVKQRSDAYREAGLPDQTGDDGRPAGARAAVSNTAASSGASTGSAGVATASLAPQAAAPAAASTGGLFANLFGGFNKQAAAPAPAPEPKPVAAQPATSGWSSKAEAVAPTAKAAPAAEAPAAKPKAAPVKTASIAPAAPATTAAAAAPGIHARIALVRTDAEAEAVKQRLVAQHAAALGGLAPTTSQAAFGGMGSFVQVRVGPYANVQQAQALCAKLKGSGLDCVPVDR